MTASTYPLWNTPTEGTDLLISHFELGRERDRESMGVRCNHEVSELRPILSTDLVKIRHLSVVTSLIPLESRYRSNG